MVSCCDAICGCFTEVKQCDDAKSRKGGRKVVNAGLITIGRRRGDNVLFALVIAGPTARGT